MTREGIGEGDGGDPSLVSREREHSPLRAQMLRNSATELSTTSFFGVILTGKGDILEVVEQLAKW